jgi:Holliday junction resolvase
MTTRMLVALSPRKTAMSKSQRRKGADGERELVNVLHANGYAAEKVSAMYKAGPDVVAFGGRVIEVKRPENPISKTLEKYLRDVNLVATRADRGEWHVWLKLDELLDLIEEGPDYEHG